MKTSTGLEKDLYATVRDYLSSPGGPGCITWSYDRSGNKFDLICRGQGQRVVDVYGLRGGRNRRTRRLEGIAVEVKRKKTSTPLRYIAQAVQYSQIAHRCYLAQPFDFSDRTKAFAADAGVGLLRIFEDDGRVQLVAESRRFEPDPLAFALFLHNSLGISQCAVCGCYQFRYFDPYAGSRTGGGHWRRDHFAPKSGKHNTLTFHCNECETHWASTSAVNKLVRRVTKLEKRLARLTSKLKANSIM